MGSALIFIRAKDTGQTGRVNRNGQYEMAKPVVLVLGATGRIGQLMQLTPPEGLQLRLQSRVAPPVGSASDRWQLLDPLRQPEALARAATGAAAILCLAGPVPGRGSGNMQDHVELGLAAVHAAASAGGGCRVLLASSAAVYGAQTGVLSETTPLQPTNAYGVAKMQMEQQASALARRLGVALCCLRIGNVAGLDAILGGWRAGFTLDRFGDGCSPRRSYIGPRSLAQVLAQLLALDDLPPQLNLAQPTPIEMAALLRAAGRRFDWQPAPAAAIAEVALDVGLLQSLLPQPLPAADAAQMVAEWTKLEPHFTQESRPQ